MPIQKVSFEDSLGKHVLPTRCIGCGTCVVVCPFNCLELENEQPRIVKACQVCGICPQTCPQFKTSMPELEKFVFGREGTDEEEFGIYRRIVIAQATDENMRSFCQDGGVVTSLLILAFDNGMIDSAVVSGLSEKEPLKPIPRLVTKANDLLGCAGTRYTYSPNMLALKEGVLQKREKIAYVGTPDQINAVRKIQMVPLRKYSNPLALTIGLFCSESFTYEGLVKGCIQEKLGIDPQNVKKINIKGKFLIETKSGDVGTFPLKEAKKYVSKGCASCPDFSAELADISAGGLGLDGWTLTVLRTDIGEKFFRRAEEEGIIRIRPIEDEKDALNLLTRISKSKRRVVQEHT